MCVSNSDAVKEIVGSVRGHLKAGTVIVDCTSGSPDVSLELSKDLDAIGVHFVDAPISGGITGAQNGTLTTMYGGSAAILAQIRPILETFSTNIVHVGDQVGSGQALKGINNLMNVAHFLIAAEGLISLSKRGIRPEVALAAINGSSGRSLATTARFPQHVLPRNFNHGFTVELMDKDAGIGASVLEASFPEASILLQARRVFHEAGEFVGSQADYMECVKYLEHLGGVVLQNPDVKDEKK